jgi:serine/threonine-protein kinase
MASGEIERMAVRKRLGRYRLERRLAVGGMAEVYLAVAEGLSGFEKRVVVKRLLPQHARVGELLSMFLDEARLVATLRHPNIAEVYDVGAEDGAYFFAMEHIAGRDLRDILEATVGAPLPLPEALQIVCAVAEGLHHAHEQRDEAGRPLQIVHRDVSPSNVLVSAAGAVKLIDFGVAKWAAQRSETRHGVLKGKCAYMSPEQCRAEPLDRRSDVFSLGVLLYEVTTGHRPFERDNDFETMSAIVNTRPEPPSSRRGDYPPILDEIVMRALSPRPEDRQATARLLGQQLTAFAASNGLTSSADQLEALLRRLFGSEAFGRAGGLEGEAATREAMPTLPWDSTEPSPEAIARTMTDQHALVATPAPRRWRIGVYAGVGLVALAAIVTVAAAALRSPAAPPPATVETRPAPRTATVVPLRQPPQAAPEPAPVAKAPAPVRAAPAAKRAKAKKTAAVPAAAPAVGVWDPESAKPPP